MEREKYDDSIRRDAIGLARAAMNEAASQPITGVIRPLIPAEPLTATGRTLEEARKGAAPAPVQPK